MNQREPGPDKRWVLADSSLAIIWTTPALLELRGTLNKVIYPVLTNRLATALSQQFISHISDVCLRGGYTACRLLEYTLYNHLLF
jgi:hypothetical protein